jgi:hypothetical protein
MKIPKLTQKYCIYIVLILLFAALCYQATRSVKESMNNRKGRRFREARVNDKKNRQRLTIKKNRQGS